MKPWIRLVVETIAVIPRVVRAIRESRRKEAEEQAKEAAKVKMPEDRASTFQSSIRKAAKDVKEGR